MMRPAPTEVRGRRHATHRTSACVQAIPAVTLPEERWTGAPPSSPCGYEREGRPAPCFSDANCGGRFASCRHRQAVVTRARSAGGRAGGARASPGPRREFLRISHMRRGASDSPEGKTQRRERSCSRRSLRLWHRRVALRAVGLERKRGRKKESHSEILAALKYQRAAHGVGYRDPGSAMQPITVLAQGHSYRVPG